GLLIAEYGGKIVSRRRVAKGGTLREQVMDIAELTIAQAARAIREGELTAANYAAVLLDRSKKAASLNAFIQQDGDAVRAAARQADERRKSGQSLGPLHGFR